MGETQGTRGNVGRGRHRDRLQGDAGIRVTQGPTARGHGNRAGHEDWGGGYARTQGPPPGDTEIGDNTGTKGEPGTAAGGNRGPGGPGGQGDRHRGETGRVPRWHRDWRDTGTGTGTTQGTGAHGDRGETGARDGGHRDQGHTGTGGAHGPGGTQWPGLFGGGRGGHRDRGWGAHGERGRGSRAPPAAGLRRGDTARGRCGCRGDAPPAPPPSRCPP